MKAINQKHKQAGILIALIGCLLLLATPSVDAQNNTSEMSVNEPLFIQGSIKQISLENRLVTVKPAKEERVKIQIDEQTGFVGMSTLEELKKGQQVKVWYTAVGDKNIAEKVERLPDLGC